MESFEDPPLDRPVEAVRGWRADLTSIVPGTDTEAWELLRALEELKAAASAAQARITVGFDAGQRREQGAAGVTAEDAGAGIAAQVGLARRESPTMGARHLGLARALVEELPHTLRALSFGDITEWRATIIARESACLSRADRIALDQELSGRPGSLATMGDRAVLVAARRIAYRLDPVSFTRRTAKAESERCVTIRPAPDTMVWLSALLPARQGVATYAGLTRHADSRRESGDSRTRGQVMADTLVERVTGQNEADAIPMEVQLVMTDQALVSGRASSTAWTSAAATASESTQEPATLQGYGPVPAAVARSWVRDSSAETWIRRLYTRPVSGELVAMESARRAFSGQLRQAVVIRDQVCRTPWCGAPIRHVDHATRAADGGATSGANAQGLCAACNYAKEAPGWQTQVRGDTVETRIPTGAVISSRPPALWSPPPGRLTRLDLFVHDWLLAA